MNIRTCIPILAIGVLAAGAARGQATKNLLSTVGTVVERELAAGEVLHVDTGCLAAMMPTVEFDLERAGSIKSMIFGGEGVFFARLTGPGKVWLQSLPFSRLAGRMAAATTGLSGSRVGEGSLLGGLGDLLDGDG